MIKSLSLILLFTPLSLSEFKPKKDVLFITTLDYPTRLKRLCNIPESVTWEEIHSKDKYRKLLAEKLKEYNLKVEKRHK